MRWIIVLSLSFLIGFGFQNPSSAEQQFDTSAYYTILASEDTNAINNELINIEKETSLNNKEGYKGALLMKKAGLVVPAKGKLKLFKEGRIKFETALRADSNNTELHFLRLTIQENAPKIVKYHGDLNNDKLFIQKNYKGLSPVVQHAILNYCKKSKVLHKEDL